jgi:branched-chain amino acid transport system substrate-binding protein
MLFAETINGIGVNRKNKEDYVMKRTAIFVALGLLMVSMASAVTAAEPYKIGAVFAITGPAAWLGEPERNTVKMIEEQINAQGGINGHPLEIIVEDTVGEEAKAVMAVQKLINRDNVLAIVGPTRSGTTIMRCC